MISLLLSFARLLRDIWHGAKQDAEFQVLIYVLSMLLVGSSFFYWRIEGWSVIDSVYFSIMTMSTIGYGDFVPTTTLSKLFTIVFAIMSIGIFVAVVSKLVNIILKQKKDRAVKLKNYAADHGLKGKSGDHQKEQKKPKDLDQQNREK